MSTIPYPPGRPLSVGEILDLTFRIYRSTLVRCLLFAALGVIAGQLTNIYSLARGRTMGGGINGFLQALQGQSHDPWYWVIYVVGTVLTLTFYAAVLLRQQAALTGGSTGGELLAGLRRTPAMLALSILMAVTIIACFIPAAAFAGNSRYVVVALLLIPVSYVIVSLSCAFVALLVGGSDIMGAYVRSWRLTQGSFWRLSIIYTVALVILLVLYVVIGAVAGFLAALLGHGDVAMVTAFAEVVGVALGALATPFYGALALAVLGDLKVRKEGADLEQRISATA